MNTRWNKSCLFNKFCSHSWSFRRKAPVCFLYLLHHLRHQHHWLGHNTLYAWLYGSNNRYLHLNPGWTSFQIVIESIELTLIYCKLLTEMTLQKIQTWSQEVLFLLPMVAIFCEIYVQSLVSLKFSQFFQVCNKTNPQHKQLLEDTGMRLQRNLHNKPALPKSKKLTER